MGRTVVAGISLATLGCVLMLSPAALAQQSPSGIAGVVRDSSGGVLPGVTIEAASPALIEKTRAVVSDSQGRYNIVDLRPGTYVVTFSLQGFNTLRREGITLPSGFTATVNADMQVGSLEETVTVTGESPLVDTQNVRQQTTMSRALLESLPASQASWSGLTSITPGLTGNTDVGGTRGSMVAQTFQSGSEGRNSGTFHGKQGVRTQFDGMRIQNFTSGNGAGYIFNVLSVEEMTVGTGGLSAETSSVGVTINLIPKEGGNRLGVLFNGVYMNDHMQGDNLTDELRSRGLTTPQAAQYVRDAGVVVSGPIKQDRLWFIGVYRRWGNSTRIGGLFWNKTQGTPFYTPDLSRPADRVDDYRSHAGRITWQKSPRNKFNFYGDLQRNELELGYDANASSAPEAKAGWHFWPTGIASATWSSPVTSKLLVELGASAVIFHWPQFRQPGDIGKADGSIVTRDVISIREQSTNFTYNAAAFGYAAQRVSDRYGQRFGVTYVTGSHAFKVGFQNEQGIQITENQPNGPDGVSHTFLNGVPVSLTQYAQPYTERATMKAELGIYVQDQWTFKRLTLNPGLRFDYVNMYVPETRLPAGPFVPARDFAAVHKVPEWKNLNPRIGASFDLFGSGRTALKVSLGRYGDLTGSSAVVLPNSPLVRSVVQVTRSWNDINKNFAPDCDLHNFAANGECGSISDQNFGQNNPRANTWADDVLRGWRARQYSWDIGAEVQQQLGAGISLTGGYYRNWNGNFRVTDNLAVTPADFSPYCITAPVDPRLPGGGGYQVCGMYDLNPNKFGQVQNLVTQASHYTEKDSHVTCANANSVLGVLCGQSDFFNVTLNTRIGSGIQFGGGVDTGRTVYDACFVIDSPQELLNCRVVRSFKAQTQLKLHGSYPLPGAFVASGVYQDLPGPEIFANYPAPNAAIAPSLTRNLSGGARSATVPLIRPQTQFENRRRQLDLRLSKIFKVRAKGRLQANVDFYNVLNANSVLVSNTTFGPEWRKPLLLLDARMVQLSGQLSF